jgi:CheY-like chemotaxis protein
LGGSGKLSRDESLSWSGDKARLESNEPERWDLRFRMILRRVLVAEDDPNDLELTLAALAEQNLANAVDAVRDGAEALDYLYRRGDYVARAEGHPVVVLLDLNMPRINGIETLRQIRADPQLCAIPVVMLTSSAMESDLVESYRLGVNAYVVKPVELDAFMKSVRQIGLFWAVINEPPPGQVSRAVPSPPGESLP